MESYRTELRAALLILIGVGSVGAAEPRQPIGRWVVDFDDAQCIASRNYRTSENPLVLFLKTPPAGNIVQIGVMRPATAGHAVQLNAEVVIDQQKPLRTSVLAFTTKPKKQRVYLINLPFEQFAAARTAKVLSIRADGDLRERFALSAMEPLMKVMDECVQGHYPRRLVEHANGTLELASPLGAPSLKELPSKLAASRRHQKRVPVHGSKLTQRNVLFPPIAGISRLHRA